MDQRDKMILYWRQGILSPQEGKILFNAIAPSGKKFIDKSKDAIYFLETLTNEPLGLTWCYD
jgi:hypothetical protein